MPVEARGSAEGACLYVGKEHLRKAAYCTAELRCRTLIWSSGHARVLPVEGEVAGLKDQALRFLYMLCEVAAAISLSGLELIGLSPSDLGAYRDLIGHVQICRVSPDERTNHFPLQALEGSGYSAQINLPDDADSAVLERCRPSRSSTRSIGGAGNTAATSPRPTSPGAL
jgi:hypothetical protein